MKAYQRILASTGIVLLCILMVLGMLLAVFRSTRVQTATVGVVAEQLSRGLGTQVSVGTLSYKFPNRLLIRQVLVEDQMQDTLLFVDSLQAKADLWKLVSEDTICIRSVVLAGVRANAYRQTDSTMNYQFLVDAFRTNTPHEEHPLNFNLQIQQVRLSRISLRYGDATAYIPDAGVHLYNLNKDVIDAEIDHLSASLARNGQPLDLQTLEAHVILNDSTLIFPTLHAQLPHSDINVAELHIDRPRDTRFVDLPLTDTIGRLQALGKLGCRMHIERATFTPSDIAAFVPQLKSMNGQYSFTAHVSGRIDSLAAERLEMQYRGKQLFRGNATATGLPLMDSLYARAQCEELVVTRATLQDIISGAVGKPVILPEAMNRLGKIRYRGLLEGPLSDMTLHGAFTTALGSLRTDGHGIFSPDFSDITFNGTLSTRRFDIGTYAGNPELGTIGFTGRVDGQRASDQPFHGTMNGRLSHLDFLGYTYHDIVLNGTFTTEQVQATLRADDPNLAFFLAADAQLVGRPVYHLHLGLDHFRPGDLHLAPQYAETDLALDLSIDLAGRNVDDLTGHLLLKDVCLGNATDTFRLNSLLLSATQSHPLEADGPLPDKQVNLTSDYLNATVSGTFRWTTLSASVMRLAAKIMPSLFPAEQRRHYLANNPGNQLHVLFRAQRLDSLFQILQLPLAFPVMPSVEGLLNDQLGTLSLQVSAPDFRSGEQHLENTLFDLRAAGRSADLQLATLRHAISTPASQHMGNLQLNLGLHAEADSLYTAFAWTNPDTVHNAGQLAFTTRFNRYSDQPLIAAHILPSTIILADSTLTIDDSHISWNAADTVIQVQHFRFGSAYQYALADGVISPRPQDTVYAELRNMNLDYYLGAFTDVHNAIYFGGVVTGWVRAFSLLSDPKFEAAVRMEHAELNGRELGNVYAVAALDSLTNHVIIQGDVIDTRLPYTPSRIDRHTPTMVLSPDTMALPLFYAELTDSIQRTGKHIAHLDGEVGTGGAWGLLIYPDSANVAFVNHWCEGIIADMEGHGSGFVSVIGYKDEQGEGQTLVNVRAMAHNIGITVPYTGVRYYVTDSVIMDSVSLQFRNMHIRDSEGNPLTFDGSLTHDGHWQDLHYHFLAKTNHALVMNLPEKSQDIYSGRVYAEATAEITGDVYGCSIDVDAHTHRGTNFVFSVGGASSASENTFIEFVDHSLPDSVEAAPVARKSSSFLNLNLQIEATPEAQISVVIDPRTGDRLRGRGEGNIRFSYSDRKGMSMLGSYVLQQGTFGFTFQNVIRRDFQICEGSRVSWSGKVEEPDVDVRALYHVTASLKDLLGTEASQLTNRSNVPVNCVLNMSDNLFNPTLRFGIELPSSDEVVSTQVHSVINTEEMLMRQVLYLLVFNRFYTPEYLKNAENSTATGLNETYSLLSSTITGQINSWLSRMTDAVTLGFNFRTDGQGETASQEYEAQFEIRPVRGLLINGNLGYRYNDISNQPVFGNLDVEYMLTPNGKLRAKAYTHTIDKYSLRQASTVQGIGFVLKHDFNWPSLRRDTAATASSRRAKKQLR